jgi:hypothetical protein
MKKIFYVLLIASLVNGCRSTSSGSDDSVRKKTGVYHSVDQIIAIARTAVSEENASANEQYLILSVDYHASDGEWSVFFEQPGGAFGSECMIIVDDATGKTR